MQSTIEKQVQIKKEKYKKNKLTISDIEKFYQNNNKISKYGLEYERLSLDKKTLKNASYEVMTKIITDFSKILNWEIQYDNNTIIGAKDSKGNSISLEPGCQLEISLKPEESILDIDISLSRYAKLLDKIADIYEICFLGYGVSPISEVGEINILQKRRYEIMNSYLPNCIQAELCTKMMRKTAGIQVNIDYKDNIDAYNKLLFLNKIIPFVSGLYSNSPIENNSLTDYKSYRNKIWLHTGKDRCNLFYKNIFKGFNKKKNVFKNYIKAILDVPMLFIERNNEIIPIYGKINFNQFLKSGYCGYLAEIDDYILHQSLCFPDIRLKKCIEIRNHDSADSMMAIALCAFYKGLMLNNVENLLHQFSYLKIERTNEYFQNVAKFGLDFEIDKTKNGWDVIEELFKISQNSLSSKERMYLNPILEMIKTRKTKADVIIENNFKTAQDIIKHCLK